MLNYQSSGQGPVIVLIHGLFGSLDNLSGIGKQLAADYRVISVDVRNHGRSFHRENMDYCTLAADVIEVLDHEGVNECDLLGHSMGGKIAMQIALTAPSRVRKLIVADIAPVTYAPKHNDVFKGLKHINLTSLRSRQDADNALSSYIPELGVRQFILKNLYRTDSGFAWRCNIENLEKYYEQVLQGPNTEATFTGQTLFIKGANSDYIRTEYRADILGYFPNSTAKIINGAGHWLHAEKPVAFNKIVMDFLR